MVCINKLAQQYLVCSRTNCFEFTFIDGIILQEVTAIVYHSVGLHHNYRVNANVLR